MPARKKPENEKTAAVIPVRVKASLKKELDKIAESTGVSTSARARECLEKFVREWNS